MTALFLNASNLHQWRHFVCFASFERARPERIQTKMIENFYFEMILECRQTFNQWRYFVYLPWFRRAWPERIERK